jgi:DNA-binding CsgD family transcriptional regulator
MTTPLAVSENDLQMMLMVINATDVDDAGHGLPWSTMEALESLIPGHWTAFNGIDVVNCRHYFGQGFGAGERETQGPDAPEDNDEAFWYHYPDSICSYPERTGDLRSVTKTTDFFTLREHRKTPMYVDVIEPGGSDHEMMACLPDGPGRQLRLIVWRGRTDPDFTERDRAVLTLLRPHLHAVHQQVLRHERGTPELTNRQWELLHLVEAGLSNTQIARRLHLAESTVRKHLENTFRRLDVSSRTAAVAAAFPDRARLLPD